MTAVSQTTFDRLARIAAEQLGHELSEITPDQTWDDLEADSLDIVEIGMWVESEFDVVLDDDQITLGSTLAETVAAIETALAEAA